MSACLFQRPLSVELNIFLSPFLSPAFRSLRSLMERSSSPQAPAGVRAFSTCYCTLGHKHQMLLLLLLLWPPPLFGLSLSLLWNICLCFAAKRVWRKEGRGERRGKTWEKGTGFSALVHRPQKEAPLLTCSPAVRVWKFVDFL